MLHVLYCALGIFAWYGQAAFSKPTTYDQRQTGDLNVQIHLKDVQVVALLDSDLLDGYTDYDYDYADFTLPPILKPSTSSVPTSSVKPWDTWPTNPSTLPATTVSSIQDDSSILTTTQKPSAETSPSSIVSQEDAKSTANPSEAQTENNETIKLRINDKAVNELFRDVTVAKSEEDDSQIAVDQPSSEKLCLPGYVLNNKGRCRPIQSRRRISFVPLTMKLGSKLSQKGRFTVRKDLPIRVYKSEDKQ